MFIVLRGRHERSEKNQQQIRPFDDGSTGIPCRCDELLQSIETHTNGAQLFPASACVF